MRQHYRFLTGILVAAMLLPLFAERICAEVKDVYLVPHFHYDPVFEKDQNDYTDVGFDRCRRYLADLLADPLNAAVFSEIDYLKPFFDAYPEQRETILSLIAARRIETGGSYSEPNEMSVGGEGLIRNILYGRAYHEGVLGDAHAGVYMPFDVFGHSMQLTQILAKTRYLGCTWRKGNPPAEHWVGVTVPGLPPDFMNVAPDGSTLHHRREHYKALTAKSADDLIKKVEDKIRLQTRLGLWPDFATLSSADFSYPEHWLPGQCAALKSHKPSILLSGPSAYFDAVKKQTDQTGLALPEVTRDFSLYHAGTALTRVDLKIANRLGENAALTAEKYAVMAALLGARYPEPALDKAWRQLLFNQHHDGITGTCNDRSFFDMMGGYREAVELAAAARDGAAAFLAARVDTQSAAPPGQAFVQPVIVFNPMGWARTDLAVTPWIDEMSHAYSLKDARGRDVPLEAAQTRLVGDDALQFRFRFVADNVPSLGYAVYYLTVTPPQPRNAEALAPVRHDDNTHMENAFYSLTVDPRRGGTITGLTDKQTGRTVVDPDMEFPGNELIVLQEDRGPQYPAWELSTVGVKDMSSRHAAKVSLESGAVSQTLVVSGELPGLGKYEQRIILYNGIKRIDFQTTIVDPAGGVDPRDRNMWVVRFPTALHGTAPVIEDRFFAAARRRSLQPLSYRTDLEKMLTQSAPYSADRWVEEGAAVRLDILDRGGAPVDAIALQLCGIVHTATPESTNAARALQRVLITRGVSCTPSLDTENQDTDLLNRNFRFVLDTGGDNAYAARILKGKRADAFSQALAAAGTARMLLDARANDLDIREVQTLALGARDASGMKMLMDEITGEIHNDARIRINQNQDTRGIKERFAPDDYGIALINQGTLLHSFDNNGTLVMGLFHSAQWAAVTMDTPFAFPETKTHRFLYSLYPHAGDWRAGDTWRVGHEVNSPLTAVLTDLHPGDLAPDASFIDVRARSVALSAVKAAGNPLAFMKTTAEAGPRNGVVVRVYETEGQADTAEFTFFRPVKSAWRANMLEERIGDKPLPVQNANTVILDVGPNAVETMLVEFEDAQPPVPGAADLAPSAEPAPLIYSQYWDYNLGAAAMNNSPVTITLGFPLGDLPDQDTLKMAAFKEKPIRIGKGRNSLRLTVSNNSVDTPLKGRVAVTVPPGWTADPATVDVDLAPLAWTVVELTVDAATPVKSGWVRADLESGAGNYFSALRIRKDQELDASAALSRGGRRHRLEVRIRNNQEARITGLVLPVTPVELWPQALAGGMSLMDLTPREQAFDLAPGEEAVLGFTLSPPHDAPAYDSWAVVKVLYNGEYLYLPVVMRDL